jgi:proline dehydrogenase
MMEKYNRKTAIVFNTFQLYRHDRLSFLKQSADEAKSKGYVLGAKLVRGAYMEKERLRATEMSYEDPIQADKESTDRDFDAALRYSLEHIDHLHLFIGTHNEASCLLAADLMQQTGIPSNSDKVHFSQLYGMSDNISFNLAKNGYHVSKYLPYGPVEDVIPYLMRRAEENTSVAGQTGRELGLIKKELDRRKLSK